MSYSNYLEVMEKIKEMDGYEISGGVSKEVIKKSEELLGLTFSKQILNYYENYGYVSFFGCEIFGINPYDKSGILEGNSVLYALNDRKEYGLPNEWLPIYNFEDGTMAYLDFSTLNCELEPRVIMAEYSRNGYECLEVLAEDFGGFIEILLEN